MAKKRDDLTEVGPGIFYSDRRIVTADKSTIEFLKETAACIPSKRARLCAHPSADADQHDMLIVSCRDTYVTPHRHLTKTETMLVIEGCAEAVTFDEVGVIADVIPMGTAEFRSPIFLSDAGAHVSWAGNLQRGVGISRKHPRPLLTDGFRVRAMGPCSARSHRGQQIHSETPGPFAANTGASRTVNRQLERAFNSRT